MNRDTEKGNIQSQGFHDPSFQHKRYFPSIISSSRLPEDKRNMELFQAAACVLWIFVPVMRKEETLEKQG